MHVQCKYKRGLIYCMNTIYIYIFVLSLSRLFSTSDSRDEHIRLGQGFKIYWYLDIVLLIYGILLLKFNRLKYGYKVFNIYSTLTIQADRLCLGL